MTSTLCLNSLVSWRIPFLYHLFKMWLILACTICVATGPPESGNSSRSISSSRRHWERTCGQKDEVDATAPEAHRRKSNISDSSRTILLFTLRFLHWFKFYIFFLRRTVAGVLASSGLTLDKQDCFSEELSQGCEKWLLPLSCVSVRLCVCVEQLVSHRTDFHEIWYLNVFQKSVEKIKDSLKSEKNQ